MVSNRLSVVQGEQTRIVVLLVVQGLQWVCYDGGGWSRCPWLLAAYLREYAYVKESLSWALSHPFSHLLRR